MKRRLCLYSHYRRVFSSLLMLGLLLYGASCFAATSETTSQKRPSFTEARDMASAGDRPGARELCLAILEADPDRHEVRIYLARVFGWDHHFSEARRELHTILDAVPGHLEASLALADIERWSGRPEEMLAIVDSVLEAHPDHAELWLKRAQALKKLDRPQEALEAAARAEQLDPELDRAIVLRRDLELLAMKNKVRVNYLYEDFDDSTASWQQLVLSMNHRFKWGSGIARVNLADRFGRNGEQIEFDAYPRIPALRSYLYLNAGFSGSSLFPDQRVGAEWFRNFQGGWEASLGLRHLRFDSSNVTLWTGSLGKYLGQNFFWVRPFWSDKIEGTSTSVTAAWRRYRGDPESYTTLYVGTGSSPDDDLTTAEVSRLDSRRIRFEWQQRMHRVWVLRLRAGWRDEEFVTGNRKRLSYGVGIQRFF